LKLWLLNLPLTGLRAPSCVCLQALGSEFEIDFLNLSYTRTAEDVREARR
jgi:pyruvate kinase